MAGKLKPFDTKRIKFSDYKEILDQYLDYNDVKENKKTACLLTHVGEETYVLLKQLCAPDKPATMKYDDLCKRLEGYYEVKPTKLVARHQFQAER